MLSSRYGLTSAGPFFFGYDRALGDLQVAANVTHAAAVQGLLQYLLPDVRLVGVVGVVQLEALVAAIAPPALCAVLPVAVFGDVLALAMAALDGYLMNHSFFGKNIKSTLLTHYRPFLHFLV